MPLYSQYSVERLCGRLQEMVKQRSNPYICLANAVVAHERFLEMYVDGRLCHENDDIHEIPGFLGDSEELWRPKSERTIVKNEDVFKKITNFWKTEFTDPVDTDILFRPKITCYSRLRTKHGQVIPSKEYQNKKDRKEGIRKAYYIKVRAWAIFIFTVLFIFKGHCHCFIVP
jgi:hypothetical protein